VKIYWEHVDAADLAGYRVYRRAEGQNKATFVGEVKLPYNMFIDTKAPQKGLLFYVVSSIDMQNPANESAKSSEVKISD
jgi:fibronectin type 3 domain-containing protein